MYKIYKEHTSLKILILSCSTGEGHNSAAKAIMDSLVAKGAECEFIDPICFKSEKRMKTVSALYNNLIRKAPWFFGIIYKLGEIYDFLHLPSPVAYANSKYSEPFSNYIEEKGFDAVVSTQLFAMQAMVAVRKKHGVEIPVYCVMTDYTVIPFHKDTKTLDLQFASTEKGKNTLVKKGFSEDRICVSGIPVNPKFNIDMTKSEAKIKLGIPENKKVITILSGGAGCGNMVRLCKKMDKALDAEHLICVLPGKNEKLKSKLEKEFGKNEKVKVVGFTKDTHIYMKASEVVLSKPGGLTSTEIAVANRPFVHLKAIPGCESYNIKYFTASGLSLPGKTINSAVKQTLRLLNDAELSEAIMQKQREYIPNDSADLIAEKVLEGKI
jgi:processive 1,2-diacylglycerol beta-glucosyltransferase